MKKYYLIAVFLFSAFYFAQETISFETTEGFMPGNIHGQSAWISTPTGGVPDNVMNQTISADASSDGSYSLKIVKETMYGTQTDPIIGGFYNLPAPLSPSNFSVSFDIRMSQLNGSVFGFQGINSVDEDFVVRLDFDKTGIVKILSPISGVLNLVSTAISWTPNTWYAIKIVGSATGVQYYLNDILIYNGSAASPLHMDQLRFVHDNALGTAYIDHIKINNDLVLSTNNAVKKNGELIMYPNPAIEFVKVNTTHDIKSITISDTTGKKIETIWNGTNIDVRHLPSGIYWISVEIGDRKYTEKIIKK
ncbi:T9SS type A sorting domain-containing protein [Chryseobacterium sp. PMSZPI]|uniref:T9SS type A sorting domain-containing protein n=1 Tax=Chryseobacterium sp. PMSZPI TaxID=1033900 RepID=UPI00160A4C80|nr:T9SS type A sorting domain-containing protein [Chryseobacterium sp. PMSZPI]